MWWIVAIVAICVAYDAYGKKKDSELKMKQIELEQKKVELELKKIKKQPMIEVVEVPTENEQEK